jgi:L-fuconolactonase
MKSAEQSGASNGGISRRRMLQATSAALGALALAPLGEVRAQGAGAEAPVPIIDSHIHLFDPTRPEGVPWPPKGDKIYGPKLPSTYMALATPLGVVGAIAVEASPWEQDNLWLLDVVRKNDFMVGFVGNLVPGSEKFDADLEKLAAEPTFLGIRYGNLWDRNGATDDLGKDLAKPGFLDGLRKLARTGRVLETANPNLALVSAMLDVAAKVPGLRIVADHLPSAKVADGEYVRYLRDLQELASLPGVYMKLSEVPQSVSGSVSFDESYYHERLEILWDTFGEDRIIFGSDWPNSDHLGPLDQTVELVKKFVARKGRTAEEKYFWRNSATAYRWPTRRKDQPQLG